MNSLLLIVLVVVVLVLVWVVIEQRKLKEIFTRLSNNVERNNNDIAGLCSAAVSVDNRISENNEQLKDILVEAETVDFEQYNQQNGEPYFNAIRGAKDGANVEELVQQYGLSRDEAKLLVRLHGS